MAEKDDLAVEIAGPLNREIMRYVHLRDEYEATEATAKRAKKVYEEQRDRLWDMLESAGVKTINHDVGRITRTNRVIGTIQDRAALTEWLEDHGMLEAFTRTDFRQQQLNGLAKEAIETGDELPEGLDVLTTKTITFTR
jgi:hypothetical protein